MTGERTHVPTYEIGGELYAVYPEREKLVRFEGRTRNPRVIALHDYAVHRGQLVGIHHDDRGVLLQHHMAGVEKTMLPSEWLDDPVAVFSEPRRLDNGDVHEYLTGAQTDNHDNGEI